MDRILQRIERDAGVPGLARVLSEDVKPTDLHSLLLEVRRRRGRGRTPAQVLRDYRTDRFVRPSLVDPRRLARWEALALERLPQGFEALDLSPLCPLGTCSAVADLSQDLSVGTDRNTEVVSDATNVLALECAVRRRALLDADPKSAEAVHLAAGHRVVRPQLVEGPRLFAHFRLLGACSAGRDGAAGPFDLVTLPVHIRYHLEILETFLGPGVPLSVRVTDFRGRPEGVLEDRILAPLRAAFPGVEVRQEPGRTAGRGYYDGAGFHIYAGDDVQLVDGGSVPWLSRLLGNARERSVVSGSGSERVCLLEGRPASSGAAAASTTVAVEPIAPRHFEGFREALDRVARERRYLLLLEAPPAEAVKATLEADLEKGVPRLVAVDGERVVGWCDISPRGAPGMEHVGSVGMGLLEEYRGRGLGHRLLQAAMEKARARGMKRVELEVFAANSGAVRLYEKCGFLHEGRQRRVRFLDGRWDDLVLMARVWED